MPSEKAMELAKHLALMVTPKDSVGYYRILKDNEGYLARELDTAMKNHTAEALAEYQRVLGMAEEALKAYVLASGTATHNICINGKSALAEIAKLKQVK